VNQAILFNDDISFDAQRHCLCFTAMQMGMRIRCEISVPAYMSKDVAIVHFKQCQFEYEAEAEELIEAEVVSASGIVALRFIS
jgi:hypothetical protein